MTLTLLLDQKEFSQENLLLKNLLIMMTQKFTNLTIFKGGNSYSNKLVSITNQGDVYAFSSDNGIIILVKKKISNAFAKHININKNNKNKDLKVNKTK